MDDADTATIELTKSEARAVINALSGYQAEVTGREGTTAFDVRDLLQREFGFAEGHFESDEPVGSALGDVFDDDDNEVQLSRGEAAEVASALADQESEAAPPETDTIADVRERFERTYELDPDHRD